MNTQCINPQSIYLKYESTAPTSTNSLAPKRLAGFIWPSCGSSKHNTALNQLSLAQEDWNFRMMNFFGALAWRVALLALTLATLVRCDANAPPDLDQLMMDVDTDKDGKISWDEVMAVFEGPEQVEQQYKVAFKECDDDKDGFINREELPFFFEILEAILHEEDKLMGSKPKEEEETKKAAKDEM